MINLIISLINPILITKPTYFITCLHANPKLGVLLQNVPSFLQPSIFASSQIWTFMKILKVEGAFCQIPLSFFFPTDPWHASKPKLQAVICSTLTPHAGPPCHLVVASPSYCCQAIHCPQSSSLLCPSLISFAAELGLRLIGKGEAGG